ncbi:protein ACCELERATED CELL DEATH 6-like [Eucalyptus grandis]|uniref:protein ACCELERATED CELL DEATH 6-like n=1 Tax=Eucalyptus grandis TaxID=71139 RepID=UPI00192E9424|nr:protein ACCELERATED CELL DEATH 6-like [Eucalyptus grandis]
MDHAMSMDDREMRAMPNERFEALKRRAIPPNYQQELGDDDLHKIMDRDVYKATMKGDVEKFIDALEKVIESRKLALSLILNQVTPSGNSLLHVAASFGSDDVMELILIHFPDIMTRKNSSEDTPLHVAIQDERFNATKKLIRRETNSEIIYWKNKDGKSPLYLAVEKCVFYYRKNSDRKECKIFELLLQESVRDEAYAVKIQGMSPILAAVKECNLDLLEEIIDRLPKLLDVRDENGGLPLHVAASVGGSFVVKLLLVKCPYLALETDKNGSYPIHIACEAGNFWAIGPLLKDTWPDLAEIKNKKRQNILHVAAKGGNDRVLKKYSETDTFEKLLNAKDDDGNTPLHLASMHNHCEVMRSLTKDKKIDLGLRNNDGLTALDVAMESRSSSTRNSALVGRAILIVAGVPRSEGRDVLSLREQGSRASKSSPTEWIKDQVNTLLLVATLVASVTFTAGLTLPSGYNASGDLHPGMAIMLHHGMFQAFVIANMVAMYSSILAVVVLLWGLNRDYYVAELAYHSAGPLLLMALTGMSMAFFAAVTVAVSRLTWLGSLVLSVGVFYLAMVVVVLAALIFPSSKTTMRIVVFYYIAVLCNGQTRKESSPLYWTVEDEHSEILTLPLAIPFGPSRIQGMSPVRAAVTHWNLVNFNFKFRNEKLSLQALIQG